MQLIGASDGFVRRPFLYSGLWYGLFGGALALIIVIGAEFAIAGPLDRLLASYDHRLALSGLDIVSAVVVIAASSPAWLGRRLPRHGAAHGRRTSRVMASEFSLPRHLTSAHPRVLVVDSSRVVRRLIEQVLKAELPECVVLCCENGTAAQARARKRRGRSRHHGAAPFRTWTASNLRITCANIRRRRTSRSSSFRATCRSALSRAR